MLGLLLFGFIVGVAFCAYEKNYTEREMIGTIVISMIASLQGAVMSSLFQLDGIPVPSQIILAAWILFVLWIKRLFLRPKNIRYLG